MSFENILDLLYDMCRLCLERIGRHDIFSNADYSRDIAECAGIQVSPEDELPQSICEVCVERLRVCTAFRKLVTHSDARLRTLRAGGPTDHPAVSPVEQQPTATELVTKSSVQTVSKVREVTSKCDQSNNSDNSEEIQQGQRIRVRVDIFESGDEKSPSERAPSRAKRTRTAACDVSYAESEDEKNVKVKVKSSDDDVFKKPKKEEDDFVCELTRKIISGVFKTKLGYFKKEAAIKHRKSVSPNTAKNDSIDTNEEDEPKVEKKASSKSKKNKMYAPRHVGSPIDKVFKTKKAHSRKNRKDDSIKCEELGSTEKYISRTDSTETKEDDCLEENIRIEGNKRQKTMKKCKTESDYCFEINKDATTESNEFDSNNPESQTEGSTSKTFEINEDTELDPNDISEKETGNINDNTIYIISSNTTDISSVETNTYVKMEKDCLEDVGNNSDKSLTSKEDGFTNKNDCNLNTSPHKGNISDRVDEVIGHDKEVLTSEINLLQSAKTRKCGWWQNEKGNSEKINVGDSVEINKDYFTHCSGNVVVDVNGRESPNINKWDSHDYVTGTNSPHIHEVSTHKINKTNTPEINKTSTPETNKTGTPKINIRTPRIDETSFVDTDIDSTKENETSYVEDETTSEVCGLPKRLKNSRRNNVYKCKICAVTFHYRDEYNLHRRRHRRIMRFC